MTTVNLEKARLAELAVEHLLGTLSVEESSEYEDLLARHPGFDAFSLERAAAALQLAAMTALDPLPERLRIRLASDAAEMFGPAPRAELQESPPRNVGMTKIASSRWGGWGWYAVAASLILATFIWIDRPSAVKVADSTTSTVRKLPTAATHVGSDVARPVQSASQMSTPTPNQSTRAGESIGAAAAREQLLASSRYVLRRSWRPGNDPAGDRVSGDVVWDPKSQRGFLRFVGLRRNNPNVEQYQLWIFDARRDERYPIDGGVFDITDPQGTEVVEIKAALKVGVPLMFAVTVERPGGVVVSDRSRIAALANIG